MQRDVYASLVKKRLKDFIPVRILQLSGEITYERVYDEVFEGHRLRRIVLMTHMAGTSVKSCTPAQQQPATLPRDVVIESFAKLKQVHQDHYLYKLLPMLCDSYVTFNALLGIVSSAGSPFKIEHRRDPSAFRMQFPPGSKHRVEVCEALLPDTLPQHVEEPPHQRKLPLPMNGVNYHGILINHGSIDDAPPTDEKKNALSSTAAATATATAATAAVRHQRNIYRPRGVAGTLCVVDTVTESVIREHEAMNRFILSPFFRQRFTSTEVQVMREFYACQQRFHFLAVRKPIPVDIRRSVLKTAQEASIHVYEGNTAGSFEYTAP